MGRVHTEAVRRLGNVRVAAVAGSSREKAQRFAAASGIDRATGDYHSLLADPTIDVVHVCAPNALHFPMAMAALKAGKHVICEKPLSTSLTEAEELLAMANQTGVRHCTFFNIRSYPQVRQMRSIVAAGDLGDVWAVQGTYSQDWLLYDTDWNWRVEDGASRTFADIGSHWCDLAEFVTGLRIQSVSADLHTFHRTRKRPKGAVETFALAKGAPGEHTQVPVTTEDFGAMMFHLGDQARGVMSVSQISAGRKNRLAIELYGTKAGVAWDAERPDELWIGRRDGPNQLMMKDPALFHEQARRFADLPGGHSEGYDDSFKQTVRQFYRNVEDPAAPADYPTFRDGVRQLRILNAVLESSRERAWVGVADPNDWAHSPLARIE